MPFQCTHIVISSISGTAHNDVPDAMYTNKHEKNLRRHENSISNLELVLGPKEDQAYLITISVQKLSLYKDQMYILSLVRSQ